MKKILTLALTLFIATAHSLDVIEEQYKDIVRETEADLKKLATVLTHEITPTGVIATTAMRNLLITTCSYHTIKMIIPKHTKSTVCGAVAIGISEQACSDTNTLDNGIKYGAYNHKSALKSLKKNRARCLSLLQNMKQIEVSKEQVEAVSKLESKLDKIIQQAECEKPTAQTITPEMVKLCSMAGSAIGSVTFLGCKLAVKVLTNYINR